MTMIDPHLFIAPLTPATCPTSPIDDTSPASLWSPLDTSVPPDQLLMQIQMVAFAEQGIGSELEML